MTDPLARYPGYALRRAATAAGAQLNERLAALGLRQSSVSVLLLVAENPDITASALGRKLDIQRANMVPLLKRMEQADLIARRAIDGKSQGLVLTSEGERTCKAARKVIDAFEAELIARVPAKHRDHLLPALNALWD